MILPDSGTPQPMKYMMIGEDTSTVEEKLAKYTGNVPWSYLAPHMETGSLFFVDPALKLEEVGAAISANAADKVEAWLKTGDLVKIGELHAAQWQDSGEEFEALVVSPFVLCRPA
ncbi:MAG: DUF2288 family protein [Verrucomicrobiaceae bacterium]|nr:MAG: DUF2288 family protein [Verrucomicrobiaceae bacterium]